MKKGDSLLASVLLLTSLKGVLGFEYVGQTLRYDLDFEGLNRVMKHMKMPDLHEKEVHNCIPSKDRAST